MAHGATNFDLAAQATNELAVDLHRRLATGDENLCISPYSIESALAMTFAGADGETRTEMARVLHFPGDAGAVPASVQVYIVYDAAVPATNATPEPALELVRYLSRDATRAVWIKGGLEPAGE